MGVKENFIADLENAEITDETIVMRYIYFGVPYIFENDESLYYKLVNCIYKKLSVSCIHNVRIVGSARLGFSIAPKKLFIDINEESDIDIAIIDEKLFDAYWEKLFEFNLSSTARTEEEQKKFYCFLKYLYKGWIRPDLFPFEYEGRLKWFDFFKELSYKEYDKRKVTAAIYKNEYFFKQYHLLNIRKIRSIKKDDE